jgi:hypothetical protein
MTWTFATFFVLQRVSRSPTPINAARLRACMRIGELSRELEKATANQYTVHLPSDGKKQTKEQVLAEARISTTSANRIRVHN